jgi:chromosome segregation ATPase
MATMSDAVKFPHLPTSPTLSTNSLSSVSTTSFPHTPKYSTYAVFKTTPIDIESDEYNDDDNDTLTIMTPRYSNKSNIVKSITTLYSKEKSFQFQQDKLTSAAKFLKGLQSNGLASSNSQSSELQATHATLSHRHSLAVLNNRKSLLPELTTSIPKRKKKMSNIFVRLSSSAASTKNKTYCKANTNSFSSLSDTQIPKLTCESLTFRKHQHSLNKSISTPVLNNNRSSSSSSSLPSPRPSELPRKSSKRAPPNSPTNLKVHSTQSFENFAFVDDTINVTKSSDKLSIPPKKTSQSFVPLKPLSTMRSKATNTRKNSIPSPPLSPLSPSPIRRQRSTSLQSTTAYSVKATLRMKSHNRSQTSISSMNSSTCSTFSLRPSNKVEQLKTKINELQQVLEQEKHERESIYTRVERVEYLENELSRERDERMQLLAKLRLYENGNNKSVSRVSSLSNESCLSSAFSSCYEEDSYLENCDSAMGQRVAYLESQLAKSKSEHEEAKRIIIQEKSICEREILNGQRQITELKLSREGFKTENDALKMQIQTLTNNLSKAEAITKQTDKQLSCRQSKLEYTASRVTKLENTIDSLNKDFSTKINSKNVEIKDLTTLLTQYKSQSHQLTDKVKRLVMENQALQQRLQTLEIKQNEMTQAACSYQKQVTIIDREFRRAILHITSLETSLQDLKISLEEKAMENDELNWSIQRVMEQANDTIEGAKRRHSLRKVDKGR